MATNSSPPYGEATVRSSGLTRRMSEPRPARVGRNGTRHAAAWRPRYSMPSSYSSASTAPLSLARRKLGSSGMESSETNPNTTFLTFPAAHSRPTSGPP
jgi:hypothetical protein